MERNKKLRLMREQRIEDNIKKANIRMLKKYYLVYLQHLFMLP